MSELGTEYTSVEICAGAGGQAVGLHNAGFAHKALVEIDAQACETLKENTRRLGWDGCRVLNEDLFTYKAPTLGAEAGIAPGELSLLAGGVPCPPFSFAGKQLGQNDERDLFPAMLELVDHLKPRAVMIENVRGLLEPFEKFRVYRESITDRLEKSGYRICGWNVLEARDYGVPQLRPRAILVAMRKRDEDRENPAEHFRAPVIEHFTHQSVHEALDESMRARFAAIGRLDLYDKWLTAPKAGGVAPTLVGGSKKHGGADLGPTRAKRAWAELGIDGLGVADDPAAMKDPERDLLGPRGPKLTVGQAAIIQGFPQDWVFAGRKTARYRQVGNAFPPPVADAVGRSILAALRAVDLRAAPPAHHDECLIAHSGPKQLAFTG